MVSRLSPNGLLLWALFWTAPLTLHAQAPPGNRHPPPAASEMQEVRRVFNLLVAAANRLDAAAESDFFWRSHELVSIAQGTPTLGWEAREQKTRQWYGALARQKILIRELEARALAPGAVAIMATYSQEIRAKDGRSWEGKGVWSLVFRKMKGEWRVAYEHYSYEE